VDWPRKRKFKININKIIQFLTYSDILMMSGWGLVSPILAVFVADQIVGGDVKLVGLSTTVYFIVKCFLQIPVAKWIDGGKGERDDFWVMITGSLLISLSAFLFMWAKLPWHVYAIQVVNGLGGALSYPSWLAIFTRHIDKNKEAFEWSFYFTTVDLGAALAAGLGGFLAVSIGYKFLFCLVGIVSLLGTFFLVGIMDKLKMKS